MILTNSLITFDILFVTCHSPVCQLLSLYFQFIKTVLTPPLGKYLVIPRNRSSTHQNQNAPSLLNSQFHEKWQVSLHLLYISLQRRLPNKYNCNFWHLCWMNAYNVTIWAWTVNLKINNIPQSETFITICNGLCVGERKKIKYHKSITYKKFEVNNHCQSYSGSKKTKKWKQRY